MKLPHQISLLLLLAALSLHAHAQAQPDPGPHAHHRRIFSGTTAAQHEAALDTAYTRKPSTKCLPTHETYGFHPGWSASAYTDYDFPLLNTLAYFAYVVDPATGGAKTLDGFPGHPIIKQAQDKACNVHLTVACFGSKDLATLLGNSASIGKLRDSVCGLVLSQDIDGVCLDFEGLGSTQRDAFSAFARSLSDTLHRMSPSRRLTITLPALDPKGSFDLKALAPVVDRFALMAYDFHYSGSKTTGAVAPLKDVEKAIDRCLGGGVPPTKLLLGVPYYGYEWPSSGADPGAPTTGTGHARTLRQLPATTDSMEARSDSILPWWLGANPTRQLWAEDSLSMDARFALVKRKDLAGVAIWALGYDHGIDTYWELIKRHFYNCDAEATQGQEGEVEQQIPGSGVTSAERNEYHWIWMLAGGVVAIAIMLVVRRVMR